jgi:3-methyladenine DNA glycosylase/8-oxoguanine DNA glycosylase
MRLILAAPVGFRFGSAVCSHGFFVLAPNVWDPRTATLTTTLTLGEDRAVTVSMSETDGAVVVESREAVGAAERRRVGAAVRRMLRLDENLADFHARCRRSDTHRQAAETGFGRLLRSASLFEDVVKVLCTCNVTWRQTVAMVDAIVREWGVPVNPPSPPLPREGKRQPAVRGFPTPARLARVREASLKRLARVGYRASFIHHLARDVANGRLDLEYMERYGGSTDELCRMLRRIRGVGPYAAGHLSMLVGRYDCLAIDTEMVRLLEHRYPGRAWTPAAMRDHYESWRPYQFLAYWYELWQDYVERHGHSEQWVPEQAGQSITAEIGRKI